jgi:3-methyladenine DNA glycosylase/8-oxoguanine DNA glycosylase
MSSDIRMLRLTNKKTIYLHPTPPFNFEGTVYKPSHFPESDLFYKDGVYWQTLRFRDKVYGIRMKSLGDIENPLVELVIYSETDLEGSLIDAIKSEIEFRFDMKTDLNDFYKKCENDEILHPIIKRWRGMRVSANTSLYEHLVITTVLQNATVRRSVQMLENLFGNYGVTVEFDGKRLSGFWSPLSIFKASEEELREIKLGYRAKILKRQAESFVRGDLEEIYLRKLPTPELRKRLLSIYGVGRASVQIILFEVFKRYDVLEYIPPWEQKIYSKLLFNKELIESQHILNEIKKRWKGWEMLTMHYIFEDLFWRREKETIPWLEKLIRL